MQDYLQKPVILSFWTDFSQKIGKLQVIMKSPCKFISRINVKAVGHYGAILTHSAWSHSEADELFLNRVKSYLSLQIICHCKLLKNYAGLLTSMNS
jgi:hypothetical protein